jgi:hypothetical protein
MLLSASRLRHGTLVDFGCGKGRVLRVASLLFDRVEGVTISPALVPKAHENLRSARNWKVHCMDATEYQIPSEASVFFSSNPFSETVFRKVLCNIRDSLQFHPRPHGILAYYCLGKLSAAAKDAGIEFITDKYVERNGEGWALMRLKS